jgi:hypothetical protein
MWAEGPTNISQGQRPWEAGDNTLETTDSERRQAFSMWAEGPTDISQGQRPWEAGESALG